MPAMNSSEAPNEPKRDRGEFATINDLREKLVVIATYTFRQDAELVVTYLINNGVDAVESPDDCGGTNPVVGFATGIRLLVPESQAKRAITVLKKVQGDA